MLIAFPPHVSRKSSLPRDAARRLSDSKMADSSAAWLSKDASPSAGGFTISDVMIWPATPEQRPEDASL